MAEIDIAQALQLAQMAAPHLRAPDQRAWFEHLDAVHEMMRATLQTCEQSGDLENGLQLAVTLAWYWFRRGHVTEGRRWLEYFLSATPVRESGHHLRAEGLFWLGHFACAEAKPEHAQPFFEESLSLSMALGDTRGIAYALKGLGHAAWYSGDYQNALAQQYEAVRLLALTDDQWSQAWALGQLAGVLYDMGDHAAACETAQAGSTLFRAAGDPWGCAWTLDTLGAILLFDGDHGSSRPYLEESISIWRALGASVELAYALTRLGRAALLDGDVVSAAAALGECKTLWRELAMPEREAGSAHDLGCIALAQGNTAQAKIHFEVCLEQHRATGDQDATATALYALGQIALAEHDYSGATARFTELLALGRATEDLRRMGQALHGAGRAALRLGLYRQAAIYLSACLTHWRQIEAALADREQGAVLNYGQRYLLERDLANARVLAALLADVAVLAVALEQLERAAWLWGVAQGQFEQPAGWVASDTRGDLIDVIRAPAVRADYLALAAMTRAQIGDAAYEVAWAAGQKISMTQGIAAASDYLMEDVTHTSRTKS